MFARGFIDGRRFELRGGTLRGEMIRLEDYGAPRPVRWRGRDRFEISLRP
jgi:hypothetical protein